MGPEFKVIVDVPVRFKDIDVGGHAHHSHALVYFEEARSAYWERITGVRGLESVEYILAEISVRYHARVLWPQLLAVGARVTRLSRRTFEMTYEVRGETDELLLTGNSTQVIFDYVSGRTKTMPETWAHAIRDLDSPSPGVHDESGAES
ncbi:MAG: thioesterase family protein [Longimicrobiales bacterium]|nr:thioesterase family protein [Longimicrobiales bacterium]